MTRLWTLQEAVMTKDNTRDCTKLNIQLLNGPMEFNSLMQRKLTNLVYTEKAVRVLYTTFPQYRDEISTVRFLGPALEYRSTSKPKDEAICVASILGIKPDKIAQMNTHEERMRELYRSIKLPSSILFHRADRLKLEGASWAPASMLGNHQTLCDTDPENIDLPATCSARGLHVKFFGYIVLDVPLDKTQNRFYIKEPEQADPSVTISIRDTEGQNFGKLMRETKTSGIIFYPSTLVSDDSVLIYVTSEEEGVIYGKYLSHVYTTSSPIFKDSFKEGLHKNWEKGLMRTRKLPSDQQWCIS